ncbi:MAG: cytochrome c-type biogenesis protein CcmH [Chloroflexi bacterium]|nr:cytochrome c-type biogenesis protein CcmH [Chloroflexota bacterium]
MKRRLLLLISSTLAVFVLGSGQVAASGHWDLVALSPEARLIAEKLQCPICEGQSILGSNSTTAKMMKAQVQEMVDAGWSEQQVLDYFVEAYKHTLGAGILREPPKQGVALGVWAVPPLVFLLGAALVLLLLRAWHRDARLPGLDEANGGSVSEREPERL